MIKWSGTVYRLHPLFVIMMALSAVTGYFLELVTLFGIVIIHETGHVVAAKWYGWKVTEVQLFPFGGVATVEEPDSAASRQEMVVALAGPLQNAFMIGIAVLMLNAGLWEKAWADYFIRANLIIGVFNLMPVLPLDGGRIVQALLSRRYAYYRTLIACVWLSLAISAVLLAVSVHRLTERGIDLNLFVISVFLLISNWFAYKHVYYRFIRFLVGREQRTDQMLRRGNAARPIAVGSDYESMAVAKMLKREQYHLIYVIDGSGAIRKVLPEQRLIRGVFREEATESAVYDRFMLK